MKFETVTAEASYHTTAIVDGDPERRRVAVQMPTTYSWRGIDREGETRFVGRRSFYRRQDAANDCRDAMFEVLDLEVITVEEGQ